MLSEIVVRIKISNAVDPAKNLECDAIVDTGATELVLPSAWKGRLGDLKSLTQGEAEMANMANMASQPIEIGGPVAIEIPGFRVLHGDIVFMPMEGEGGKPLIGHTVLEHLGAGVDMANGRLIQCRRTQAKRMI